MKKLFILLIATSAVLMTGFSTQDISSGPWNDIYPEIAGTIKEPVFKSKVYNITKYGAVRDNPDFLNDKIINSTIDLCSRKGGGTVLIPEGTWHTGPIVLKSRVNLKVDEGAVLLFTSDTSKYPVVLTRWEGMDCINVSPMIYAYDQKDIAITGKGTIDGGATMKNWWGMRRLSAVPGKELRGRPLLMEMNEKGVPVEKRIMRASDNLRPQLINIYKCRNVLIRDVTLTRPAFWTIHPLLSENVSVKGVTIVSAGAPNGDGWLCFEM